ncbi:MAG TPA: hypothetical protein VFU02_15085 [Polyangiaceae bacterium]|nr:hypothetical protein [Polyangiaceae bacterium]
MKQPRIEAALAEAHILHASSAHIQKILLPEAERLGFNSERSGLFVEYATGGVRPDYYRKVGRSGILMEVERGKTLANNMDLLDLWKCHICREADYLFLVIPQRRPRGGDRNTPVFGRVVNRIGTFFQEPNLVNVEAAFLFGY